MSKIKIYELAKELNVSNKEIIEFLNGKNIEAKSHMSSLEDADAQNVRKAFKKDAAPKAEASKEAEAPKKKNIVHVFRPQNTQNAKQQGKRPGQKPPQGHPQGRPMQVNNGRPAKGQPAPAKPAQPAPAKQVQPAQKPAQPVQKPVEKPVEVKKPQAEPVAEKVQAPVVEKPQAERQESNVRPQNDRPQGERRPYGDRPQGERRPQGDRPQGERRSYGDRPQGERRPQGDRPQGERRPYGDRPQGERRPQGDRSQGERRPYGDRPQGERRPYGDRPQGERRPQGDRPQGERRPYGDRPQGDRPFQGNRQDDRRDNRRDDRRDDRRDGGRDDRRDNRRDDRRNSGPSIPAPEAPMQKPQRKANKGKDDYKKKDYRHENEDGNPKAKGRKNNDPKPQLQKPQQKEKKQEEQIKSIIIPETLTIQELADKMKIVPSVIVKKLFMQGKIVTMNQEINYETAEEIAMEFEILCEKEEVVDVIEELLREEEEDEKKMKKRPPVVCVMGHVDHGKTSLLDAIRHTNVISGEAGGITQHIGAYIVEVNGEKITFLDTPGHEAFTAMRMRGASSTDIAILVVAADDGVMPQTVEAINHAKAAGVDIVVAVNKIDKPSANVDRVKQEMTEYGLIAEDWGGSTIFVPVSAKTGEGLEELMEMLLLTAEMGELKANPNRRARGLVLEAELDKGRGPVATVLVQKGTLRVGDPIAAGSAFGKVRAMMDDKGRRVKEAGPSVPVEILGLNDVPNAGEVFVGCGNDKEARSFAETFIAQNRAKLLEDTKSKLSLDDLFNQIQEGNLKELNIIVKADVQGSVEAMKQSLLKLSNDEVVVKIIHGGVGAINESDVTLASASNAIIIGFNVRPDAAAKASADSEGVDVRLYRVIYSAIEDVEAAMKGMLDPVFEEKVLGHAEVRQTFKASGVGTIAGSYVLDGTFERDCSVRITRDGIVIFEGALASLRRFKDDVKEVRAGYECGFVFANFNDVKEGDLVEAFKMVEIPR